MEKVQDIQYIKPFDICQEVLGRQMMIGSCKHLTKLG